VTAVIDWVVLTRGDRPTELAAALESVRDQSVPGRVLVVQNGTGAAVDAGPNASVLALDVNVGIPMGRDRGLHATATEIVGFLDDDAIVLDPRCNQRLLDVFDRDPNLGAVSLRIVDDSGRSARRHIPRIGFAGERDTGQVTTFLGGACAIRREAYVAAGGYWPELFYAHEELDLAWRLYDNGYSVEYLADVPVRHPSLPISRHADGWRLTGRNRVMIARRNLPWAVALIHVTFWLVVGTMRAPDRVCRSAYVSGWRDGWRQTVPRHPMQWRTAWRLTRLGRPPIV
jgi:GT2 family glycosyltransferase